MGHEPLVNTRDVKSVAAVGQHAHHLPVHQIPQANHTLGLVIVESIVLARRRVRDDGDSLEELLVDSGGGEGIGIRGDEGVRGGEAARGFLAIEAVFDQEVVGRQG